MNNILKKEFVLALLLLPFMSCATTSVHTADIRNKPSLTGLQITLGLVGATTVLATVTGLWFVRTSFKKEQDLQSSMQERKKKATRIAQARTGREDRIIESDVTLSAKDKVKRHQGNILELARKRMMIEYPDSTVFAHQPFWRRSPWGFLKNCLFRA